MPGTVISRWFGQVRQNSRGAPTRLAPGWAFMNNLGMVFAVIQLPYLGDGCGFAVDGDLARPGEGGAAALAGLGKGTLVLGQDLGCQGALHA